MNRPPGREIVKARDRAYTQRRKNHRTAMDAAVAAFDEGPEKKAADEAHEAFHRAFDAATAERRAIDDRIRLLKEQQEGLNAKHRLEELGDTRRRTWSTYHDGKRAVEMQAQGH